MKKKDASQKGIEEVYPPNGVVKLEEPYEDVRGSIQPLVDTLMNSAIIESKAGSIRANHYHKRIGIIVMYVRRDRIYTSAD